MNSVISGHESHEDAFDVLGDLAQDLRRLGGKAKPYFERHVRRMKTDSDYQTAVQHLTELLSSRSGHAGWALQKLVTGHTLLIKLL